MAVCHHTSHVQILNADGVEPAREIGRELVLGIIADVAAAGRQPRQLRLGFRLAVDERQQVYPRSG